MLDTQKKYRIDAWLWSVRLCKTRSEAATACRGGHVKINGSPVKPSTPVVVGDTVKIWIHHQEKIVEVSQLLAKRVGAQVAGNAYIDKSPPRPSREVFASLPQRDRGAGRPTKKERRQLDKLRNQDTHF